MEINDLVVASLKNDHGLVGRIWTIENAEKYSTLSEHLSDINQHVSEEIFALMTSLNTEGVTNVDLCASSCGRGSLGELLWSVASDLADLLGQDSLHYVELGPEPVKTSVLMGYLLESGVEQRYYTAVDINRASHTVMRNAVEPLLETPQGFCYLATDFRDLRRHHLERGQDATLITMLGFQEGNELPDTIGEIIRQVGGTRTYVLSEMQLSTGDGDGHIHRFYGHDCMSRFSDLIGLKLGLKKTDSHQVFVSEIEHNDDRFRVAATLLPVSDGHDEGYLLTNVCLKYTREQFVRVRQEYGGYRVIGEYCSGDGSVMYQLSEYCLDHSSANG
ncbi:hypothetical protein GNF76_23685 [Pseudomonas sp. CCM 7893]|uniref:Histidine-specific methyltransferase SAM-dependent domain-containing protein n=1 Tax=Pseudomonas spelaei TaxID=1055469 RepID=A0A6I3WJ92_9PSED|nr:hypothetical protein [Pseudomonas spelaei]MUF07359.1 hypothetical protein [Pseudomonas spelaei]